MSFRLVDELEEDIVYRSTYERSEVEEFAINAMKGRLEEISFSWILAIEQLEELVDQTASRKCPNITDMFSS